MPESTRGVAPSAALARALLLLEGALGRFALQLAVQFCLSQLVIDHASVLLEAECALPSFALVHCRPIVHLMTVPPSSNFAVCTIWQYFD